MDFSEQMEKIRDLDDKLHLIIEASFSDLAKEVIKSSYPMTGRALVSLSAKTNFIKNSIFDLCETGDFYSGNILFRSLMEHYLRHQYIFFSYAKNKNDDMGKAYYEICDMGENLDFLKAIKSARKIFGPENTDIDDWKDIGKLDPRLKKYPSSEIYEKCAKFKYKNIIRFLYSAVPAMDKILIGIIPDYAELSSFVHGGVYSEHLLISHSKQEVREKALKSIAEKSFIIAKEIKLYTYLFGCQINKNYGIFYNQIESLSLNLSV